MDFREWVEFLRSQKWDSRDDVADATEFVALKMCPKHEAENKERFQTLAERLRKR